ncbi:unnamed protein product [Ectocarpus fasciculatus]
MGQYASTHDHLPTGRISVEGGSFAEHLGFSSFTDMENKVTQNEETKRLTSSELARLTHAEKLQLAHVAQVELEIETLPQIVSFGEPVRAVSSAFCRQLMDSFYEGGLVFQEGESILTVCMEFVTGDSGRVNLVCIGGNHRAHAILGFLREQQAKLQYDWSQRGWTLENGRSRSLFVKDTASVRILYVGAPALSAPFVHVALALNHQNEACAASSLVDQLSAVLHLRRDGRSKDEITSALENCTGIRASTAKQYASVIIRVGQHPECLEALTRWNDTRTDTDRRKGFFTVSKFHKETREVRRILATAGDFFFIQWTLHHLARDGRVDDQGLTDSVRKSMTSCARSLQPVRSKLEEKLGHEPFRSKLGVHDDAKTDDLVGRVLVTLMKEWPSLTGVSPNRSALCPSAVDKCTPKALCKTLQSARGCSAPEATVGPSRDADELMTHCQQIWAPDERPRCVDGTSESRTVHKTEQRRSRRGVPSKPAEGGKHDLAHTKVHVEGTQRSSDGSAPVAEGKAAGGGHPESKSDATNERVERRERAKRKNSPGGVANSTTTMRTECHDDKPVAHSTPSAVKETTRAGVNMHQPRKRRYATGRGFAAIRALNGNGVRDAIERATPGLSLASRGVYLLVWDVAMSGSAEFLREILHDLHVAELLEGTRVVLFGRQPEARGTTTPATKWSAATETARNHFQDSLNLVGETASETVLEVRVGGNHVKDPSWTSDCADALEVTVSSSQCASSDVYHAHMLQHSVPSVFLDKEDPSLASGMDGSYHTHLLTGPLLCRIKDSTEDHETHKNDEDWDTYLTGQYPRNLPHRGQSPSVDTLMALLYRSGAVAKGGIVVITCDPYGSWTEACAKAGLTCAAFVSESLPPAMIDGIYRRSRPNCGKEPDPNSTTASTPASNDSARHAAVRDARSYPRSTVLGPITEDQYVQVSNNLMRPESENNIVVVSVRDKSPNSPQHQKGEWITVRDLKALTPGAWLRTDVINAYFVLLGNRNDRMCSENQSQKRDLFMSTHFMTALRGDGIARTKYDFDRVKRWTRKLRCNPVKARMIFVPHNVGLSHWQLFVITPGLKSIQCYDSLPANPKTDIDNLLAWMEDVYDDWYKDHSECQLGIADPADWAKGLAGTNGVCARQENGHDCGAFTCCFANILASGKSIAEVTQSGIDYARMKMASQLLEANVE